MAATKATLPHVSGCWTTQTMAGHRARSRQNGCVRILSQPAYPNAVPTSIAIDKLGHACAMPQHQFWSDSVSLVDETVARRERIHGPRQLTDLYLLALAVHHGGRFVTFDGAVATTAVRRVTPKHLVVI